MGTVSLVSLRDLPKQDIIIDISKGYALRRIGTYSPYLVEEVVHSFIPFNDFCSLSPEAEVWTFHSLSRMTKVAELATIMTSRHTVPALSSYTVDTVSSLIRKDINRILAQYHSHDPIVNSTSIFHFINNQFYYEKNDESRLATPISNNVVDNYLIIPRVRATSVQTVLKQINKNMIGFEYLSDTGAKLFLSAIFSSIDSSYVVSNVHDSLDTFVQVIVGQPVFALRYCSFYQKNSLLSQPCLLVSSLFLRIPTHSISSFSTYSLIPLPVTSNGNTYIYSTIPKVIGINLIDQTVLMWDDMSDINECIFSYVVQCQKTPVVVQLSKAVCLSQLFDNEKSIASACPVIRSQDEHQNIMTIDDGIWLFFNVPEANHCQTHSISNDLIQTVSINEASILKMSCDKQLICMGLQVSAKSCVQRSTAIIPSFMSNVQNFVVPIRNLSTTLVSTYELQLQQSTKDILTIMKLNQSQFTQFIHEFGTYVLSFFASLCCLLFSTSLNSSNTQYKRK